MLTLAQQMIHVGMIRTAGLVEAKPDPAMRLIAYFRVARVDPPLSTRRFIYARKTEADK